MYKEFMAITLTQSTNNNIQQRAIATAKMRYGQLVMGPAGSGKSTYCTAIHRHCSAQKRAVHIINMDPAAEYFDYPVSLDIRDLISVDDVMSELNYGPNGGLVYAMTYLSTHLNWLSEYLEELADDSYVIFDCPGQIELYTHLPVMANIVAECERIGYRLCAIWCLDVNFCCMDAARFISGVFMSLSVMVQIALPHINILTKCDQLNEKQLRHIETTYLDPDMTDVLNELRSGNSKSIVSMTPTFARLNEAVSRLIEEYNIVNFLTLNIQDEESIDLCLLHIDNAIQYGEDLEPKEPLDNEIDE